MPTIPVSDTERPEVTVSETVHDVATAIPEPILVVRPAPRPIYGFDWKRDGKLLIHYLLDSEVHTFAFSVAANAILSFIPFIVMLYTISQRVFHSQAMLSVILDMVQYFFPANQDFEVRNLARVASHQGIQFFSMLMILVSCTGIFLPLEVALNRSWGVKVSRNYLLNQFISLGLAAGMVFLGMTSILINTAARGLLTAIFFGNIDNFVFRFLSETCLVVSTSAASILFFFSIYWALPNRKVPWRPILRVSAVVGLVWVAVKYLFAKLILPHLDLQDLYGAFSVSVGLIIWAYVTGLLLFAGAQFTAMRFNSRSDPEA